MTVATRNQPDVTTAADASEYFADVDASLQVDCEVAGQFAPREAAPPGMSVWTDPGRLMYAGTLVIQPQQSSGIIAAPVTNPRIDRVVIDEIDGSISVVTGTEAASPSAPAIPAGYSPCCQILLATSTTAITNSMITDERHLLTGQSTKFLDSAVAIITGKTSNDGGSFNDVDLSSQLSGTGAKIAIMTAYCEAIDVGGGATLTAYVKAHVRKNGSSDATSYYNKVCEAFIQVGGTPGTVSNRAAARFDIELDSNYIFEESISISGSSSSYTLGLVGYKTK